MALLAYMTQIDYSVTSRALTITIDFMNLACRSSVENRISTVSQRVSLLVALGRSGSMAYGFLAQAMHEDCVAFGLAGEGVEPGFFSGRVCVFAQHAYGDDAG